MEGMDLTNGRVGQKNSRELNVTTSCLQPLTIFCFLCVRQLDSTVGGNCDILTVISEETRTAVVILDQ